MSTQLFPVCKTVSTSADAASTAFFGTKTPSLEKQPMQPCNRYQMRCLCYIRILPCQIMFWRKQQGLIQIASSFQHIQCILHLALTFQHHLTVVFIPTLFTGRLVVDAHTAAFPFITSPTVSSETYSIYSLCKSVSVSYTRIGSLCMVTISFSSNSLPLWYNSRVYFV